MCQRRAESGMGEFIAYSTHHKILERKYIILYDSKIGIFYTF
jgi:hypothetical protein